METVTVVPSVGYELAHAIDAELGRAARHGAQFASLQEAYGVIFEELDEIWDHTRLKRLDRNRDETCKELVQFAAMAIKGLHSLDNFVGGTV